MVALDGRVDWTVCSSATVLAYSPLQESSLNIVPAKLRGGVGTEVVTGRGVFAVTGDAPTIFKVSLDAGESFLVARSALLAYALDVDVSGTRKLVQPVAESIASSLVDSIKQSSSANSSYISRIGQKLMGWGSAAVTRVRSDTTPFVRMYGPSTLLIQSSSSSSTALLGGTSNLLQKTTSSLFGSTTKQRALETEVALQLIKLQETKTQLEKTKKSEGRPQDYLKIATVVRDVDSGERKVTFESTASFKDFK